MKIAYLYHRSDTIGGAPIHLRDLTRRLNRDGHEAKIFIGGDGPFLEHLEEHRVPYETLRFMQREIDPRQDLPALFELFHRMRSFRPDVISAHCPKAGFAGRIVGKLLGIPTVYTPHCWPFVHGAPRARLYRALEKLVIPYTTRIFVVSEDERREALANRLCSPDLMTTVHNGMLDTGRDELADPGASPPRMIMVARFEDQKDHETLFRALEQLRHLDWNIDLVGSGPNEALFRKRGADLGMTDRIVFHGHSSAVPELLRRSQLFLLITHWEGFPRSTLEAMRAGLPSIVTDIGGNREAFVTGGEGITVPRKSVEALASALETLLTDPDSRVSMGIQARKTFEEHFTFEIMYRKYLDHYRDLEKPGSRVHKPEAPVRGTGTVSS